MAATAQDPSISQTSDSEAEEHETAGRETRTSSRLSTADYRSFRSESVFRTLEGPKEKLGKKERVTPAIKALILTSLLFSTITVAQYICAKIAHSQALLMDCVSMAVDAFTYMGNIIVECKKRDRTPHNCSQLVVCAISLSLLLYFTIDASRGSIHTVQACRHGTTEEDGGDDVDGRITLAFGAFGLIFDVLSLWAFSASAKKEGQSVNMFTAFLHVGADFLRSGSTVVMSLLILVGGYNSTCLDAYTSLLIGASIACGGAVGVINWMMLAYSHFCGGDQADSSDAEKI